MAWIVFFQLLFPSAPAPASAPDPASASASVDEGLRYRGIEAMFARFAAESP